MNDENPFAGLEPPAPPPGLREAALRSGRAAFAAAPAPPADVWTKLLKSPAARLAWAASVAALVAGHLLLPGHGPYRSARGTAATAPPSDPEVGAIAHLPRIDERVLAAREGVRS